ncbi:MAG: hypothetical protein J5912_06280 [Clostridia bacterium]|nr:hypothetical protein [Clostridia bacterium]
MAFLLGFVLVSFAQFFAAGLAFIRREHYTTGARGKQDRKGRGGFFKGLSIIHRLFFGGVTHRRATVNRAILKYNKGFTQENIPVEAQSFRQMYYAL